MPGFAMCLHAGSTEVLVTLNTVPSCYLTLQFHINIRQNILKRLIHEKKKKHGYKFWFGNTFAQKWRKLRTDLKIISNHHSEPYLSSYLPLLFIKFFADPDPAVFLNADPEGNWILECGSGSTALLLLSKSQQENITTNWFNRRVEVQANWNTESLTKFWFPHKKVFKKCWIVHNLWENFLGEH